LRGAGRTEESEQSAAQAKKERNENAGMQQARFGRGFRAHNFLRATIYVADLIISDQL
jgi:hypothetical protein